MKEVEETMCKDDLFCGVNSAASPVIENMTDLEKKHTPVIVAPQEVKKGESFEVAVEVGKYMAHPNENAHFIEWIELYSGETFLARVDLIPKITQPRVSLNIALDHQHPLTAKVRCNLHGLWQSFPFEIKVE
jgi:superoxide reductase